MDESKQTLQQEGKNLQSELSSAFARCYAALTSGSNAGALLSGTQFTQGNISGGSDRRLWKQDTVLEQEIASLVAGFYSCIQLNPKVLSAIQKLDANQAQAFAALFAQSLAASQSTTVRDILRTISKGISANEPLKAIAGHIHTAVQRRIAAIEKMLASLCRQANQLVLLWKYKQNGHISYQYITERENCETCSSLDGQVFAIVQAETGVNLPPMHPNCDCYIGILDRDGNITALVGSGERGFDLLHLPDNILRTPGGTLGCRFDVLAHTAVDGLPLVLWTEAGRPYETPPQDTQANNSTSQDNLSEYPWNFTHNITAEPFIVELENPQFNLDGEFQISLGEASFTMIRAQGDYDYAGATIGAIRIAVGGGVGQEGLSVGAKASLVDFGGYFVIPIPGNDTSVKVNGEVFLGLGAEFSIAPQKLKIGLGVASYTFEIIQ